MCCSLQAALGRNNVAVQIEERKTGIRDHVDLGDNHVENESCLMTWFAIALMWLIFAITLGLIWSKASQ